MSRGFVDGFLKPKKDGKRSEKIKIQKGTVVLGTGTTFIVSTIKIGAVSSKAVVYTYNDKHIIGNNNAGDGVMFRIVNEDTLEFTGGGYADGLSKDFDVLDFGETAKRVIHLLVTPTSSTNTDVNIGAAVDVSKTKIYASQCFDTSGGTAHFPVMLNSTTVRISVSSSSYFNLHRFSIYIVEFY